ncbi:MAG: flagellar protein FlbD [Firmicutes bacterium]|nr:flagellar protein FlbD [Bacillota bacterium]
MIKLTKLRGDTFYLNAELIESIEAYSDTIISLTGDKKVRVRETSEEVVEKIIKYKRKIHSCNLEVKK